MKNKKLYLFIVLIFMLLFLSACGTQLPEARIIDMELLNSQSENILEEFEVDEGTKTIAASILENNYEEDLYPKIKVPLGHYIYVNGKEYKKALPKHDFANAMKFSIGESAETSKDWSLILEQIPLIPEIQVSSVFNNAPKYEKKSAFDDDSETIWHSKQEGYEWISIEFANPYKLSELKYLARQSSSSGRIGDYEIHVKYSKNGEFKKVKDGTFDTEITTLHSVDLSDITKKVAAIKIMSAEEDAYMSAAKLDVMYINEKDEEKSLIEHLELGKKVTEETQDSEEEDQGSEEELSEYWVEFSSQGNGSIKAEVDGVEITNGEPVEAGKKVTFTATAAESWQFEKWQGDASGTETSKEVTVDANTTVTAVFKELFTLTVNDIEGGSGTVSPDAGSYIYSDGTEVDLSVTPDYGFGFVEWQGDVTGTSETTTITMDSNKSVTAVLEEATTYTLTTEISGYGNVNIDPDKTNYFEGDLVDLTATPDSGWEFKEWQGDVTGTSATKTVTMDADKTVTAVFSKLPEVVYSSTFGKAWAAEDNAIDNDPNTTWSSGQHYPQWIAIELGGLYKLKEIKYYHKSGVSGRIDDYEIWVKYTMYGEYTKAFEGSFVTPASDTLLTVDLSAIGQEVAAIQFRQGNDIGSWDSSASAAKFDVLDDAGNSLVESLGLGSAATE